MSCTPTIPAPALAAALAVAAWMAGAGPVPAGPPATPWAQGQPAAAVGLKSGSTEALSVQLEGAKVVSAGGEIVGEVEKVVEGPRVGPRAVLRLGGFLGFGAHRVAVPAESLVPSGRAAVRSDLTETQLRRLPAYID
ncbi:hypothetical protein GCM10017083_46140 [Thalassobaculum fulvum]|uniref:PRC-barrel domain-containing protein n=1 Tax=Thalassobaculum fulvum TaxID=1633335 RepID=A0A918XX45_9PROT|nr:PRC-barrel domain-containing protein [Thalassobaculum fulvum]GHD60376.1 hypothetical protein GCM10017083_46140 [Thalassobaculum fulvum]